LQADDATQGRRMTPPTRVPSATELALGPEATMQQGNGTELSTAHATEKCMGEIHARLVTLITHGLRTPLSSILGYIRILQNGNELSRRQAIQADAVAQIAGDLLEIVEIMPGIAARQIKLRFQSVSVVDLAETCIRVINPIAIARGLSLRVVNAHDAPRQFVTDPACLRQALLNLLDNAVKFTDAGSVELRLLAGAEDDGLRIEIADTGCGFDLARRDQLFKNLDQYSDSGSEKTGLGLDLSARIVRQMGGTIGHQDNPQGGSVLWLELPVNDKPPLPQTNVRIKASLLGKRVLVVDDIKINLDVIGSFLKTAGHTVILATSGREAIELVTQNRFDMILMDVRMPEMDGLEATRHIRMLTDAHGHMPIVAMTVDTSFNQLEHCLNAGMDGHVPKPVDYETLIRSINEISSRV
jgi:CheY-like chemotaxis protein